MLKTCAWCEQEFDGYKNSRYCTRPHYKTCEHCTQEFLIRDIRRPAQGCSATCSAALSAKARSVERVCVLCHKVFQALHHDAIYCKDDHYADCIICDSSFQIVNYRRMAKTCSKECAYQTIQDVAAVQAKREATLKKLYGVENASQIAEVKMLKQQAAQEKYGVKNVSQAPAVQAARAATNMERFGVENAMQNGEVQDKLKQSMQQKYGVDNIFASPQFQENLQKRMLQKYGVKNILQLPENQLKAARSTGRRISQLNIAWQETLQAATGVPFLLEVPFGDGYYADLGYNNILIDINPTATHNTDLSFLHLTGRCTVANCQKVSHAPRATGYHYDRFLAAERNGKIFLQFFEWMDVDSFLQSVQKHVNLSGCR